MKTFIAVLMLSALPALAQPPAKTTHTRVKMTTHGRHVVVSHHANHSRNH